MVFDYLNFLLEIMFVFWMTELKCVLAVNNGFILSQFKKVFVPSLVTVFDDNITYMF